MQSKPQLPPRPLFVGFVLCLGVALPLAAEENLAIAIRPTAEGLAVTANGAPFTEYRLNSGGKPVLWPLVGPNGLRMTRQWPLGETGEHESTDHPHQIGLWFGHGKVNGIDFWHQPVQTDSGGKRGTIVHQGFLTAGGGYSGSTIVARNDWLGPGKKIVCRDERKLRFGATRNHRWIDFSITIRPHEIPLEIGDTKEGSFAMRLAGPLRIDAGLGGQIVNSQGKRNAAAWGAPAAWVDYYGRIDDQLLGVAILSHPSNFRPRPRWHVRGYGLFAANPFGEAAFPPVRGYRQGAVRVNLGDELRLRFRVVLHLGNEQQADIEGIYKDYQSR